MSSPCDSTIVMEKVLPTCCCSAPGIKPQSYLARLQCLLWRRCVLRRCGLRRRLLRGLLLRNCIRPADALVSWTPPAGLLGRCCYSWVTLLGGVCLPHAQIDAAAGFPRHTRAGSNH